MSIPLLSGVGDLINSFLNSSSDYKSGSQSPTPQNITPTAPVQKLAQTAATALPVPSSAPADNGNFRYRMGSSDYSDVAPQVQSALKGTPLEAYSNDFIQAGNRHGVDPRVLVTVANNESSLGKNYPTDSYNPFGYNAGNAGEVTGPDGKQYVNVDQGLKNAGFTSLPMAIDRMTQRFSQHPFNPTPTSYQTFYQNPTIENLQSAYNANPKEMANYLKNSTALAGKFFK